MSMWREYLDPSSTGSAVQALSRRHSQAFVSFAPTSLRVLGAPSNSSSCSTRSFLLSAVSQSTLFYVNANLFLSRKIDQLRMLSRLSLDFTATGYTDTRCTSCQWYCEHFPLSSECQASKKNWSITARAAVFPCETSVICSVVRFNTVR